MTTPDAARGLVEERRHGGLDESTRQTTQRHQQVEAQLPWRRICARLRNAYGWARTAGYLTAALCFHDTA